MVGTKILSDLKVGNFYHIKDNRALNIDNVWKNYCKLISIEDLGDGIFYLTFKNRSKEFGIVSDYIEHGDNHYQVIECDFFNQYLKQDVNPNHWAYYIEFMGVNNSGSMEKNYLGFNSIGDAEQFIINNLDLNYIN